MDDRTSVGGAATGSAPQASSHRPGVIERLASVRLTLWLLALLTMAMAIATLIPQNKTPEEYQRVFGTLFGPLVSKTALQNIYGSNGFIGAFALLALNLLACSVHRTGQLLRRERETVSRITRAQVMSRGHRAQWRVSRGVAETAEVLAASLSRRGYRVQTAAGEAEGQRGLIARRGRLAPWVPVIVHMGMVVILVGAAWGRLPQNGYRTIASLSQGEAFPVRAAGDAFGLRLVEAGSAHNAMGQPTDFWAKVEVLEDGTAVRSEVVRPNHPLRYHGISVVLQSMGNAAPAPAGFALEVAKGDSREQVPIAVSDEGAVDPMGSYRHLDDRAWMVIVTDMRMGDESGKGGPMAKVMVDSGGPSPDGKMPGHEWQDAGWIGEEGRDFSGVHLRLVHGEDVAPPAASQSPAVQLSLDRDIGLPIVYLGFIVIALGTILLLGSGQRNLVALVSPKGQGSQAVVGASKSRGARETESLLEQLQSELGAAREAEPRRKDEDGR